MLGIVFLMLPLSILVVFVFAAIAFGDVAFRQSFVLNSGSTVTGRRIADFMPVSQANPMSIAQVATAFQNLTSELPIVPQEMACHCESFVPNVTEPEVQTIAAELRQRGGDVLQVVIDRSRNHGCSCPMLTASGYCACSVARPLACIGRCTLGGDSPEWSAGLGESVSDAFRQHLDARHVNSELRRLDDALVSLLDQPRGTAV